MTATRTPEAQAGYDAALAALKACPHPTDPRRDALFFGRGRRQVEIHACRACRETYWAARQRVRTAELAAFRAAREADTATELQAAGLKIGDQVEKIVPAAFFGCATVTGRLVRRQGRTYVDLGRRKPTGDGYRRYLSFDPAWRRATA